MIKPDNTHKHIFDYRAFTIAGKIFDRILDTGAILAMTLVAAMALTISFEVTSRYLFNNPTSWVVDVNGWMLLYMTFLASAWLLREDGHVRMTLLLERLNQRAVDGLGIFTNLIGALLSTIMVVKTFQRMIKQFLEWHVIDIGAFRFPEFVIILIVPIGMSLIGLQFMRTAAKQYVLLTTATNTASADEAALEHQIRTSL